MTDKELLELAAKAAGVEIIPMQIDNVTKQGDNRFIGFMTKADEWPRRWFDPLTDDGDALRLAVRLDLIVSRGYTDVGKEAVVFYLNEIQHQMRCVVPHGKNPYAATRLAIVRAAAEMGRAK
jgi:hypothetical protein